MNYKYTASDLYRRATELADVKNTDFLTYEEKIGYVNDAFIEEVQWARNIGEKIYVKEVALIASGNGGRGFTSYRLPDDFYSVVSLKSGGIPLKRKAESELSNGYEITNNELRVYGSFPDLILEYFLSPLTITFPDSTLHYENMTLGQIVSSYGNNLLFKIDDSFFLWNVATNALEDIGTVEGVVEAKLGEGHIAFYEETEEGNLIVYMSYGGKVLYAENPETFNGFAIDEYGIVKYKTTRDEQPILKSIFGQIHDGYYDIKFPDYFILDNKLYQAEEELGDIDFENIFPLQEYDGRRNVFLGKKGTTHYLVTIEDGRIRDEALDVSSLIFFGYTKRGIVLSNGTGVSIVSWIPDTLLNFPNDFYFSAMAADVAIRIAMKQNVNFQGLQLLVQQMRDSFVNNLNSTGQFPRIRRI